MPIPLRKYHSGAPRNPYAIRHNAATIVGAVSAWIQLRWRHKRRNLHARIQSKSPYSSQSRPLKWLNGLEPNAKRSHWLLAHLCCHLFAPAAVALRVRRPRLLLSHVVTGNENPRVSERPLFHSKFWKHPMAKNYFWLKMVRATQSLCYLPLSNPNATWYGNSGCGNCVMLNSYSELANEDLVAADVLADMVGSQSFCRNWGLWVRILDSLTARYVRTFRKKMTDGNPASAWLRRRSPLVAREQIQEKMFTRLRPAVFVAVCFLQVWWGFATIVCHVVSWHFRCLASSGPASAQEIRTIDCLDANFIILSCLAETAPADGTISLLNCCGQTLWWSLCRSSFCFTSVGTEVSACSCWWCSPCTLWKVSAWHLATCFGIWLSGGYFGTNAFDWRESRHLGN